MNTQQIRLDIFRRELNTFFEDKKREGVNYIQIDYIAKLISTLRLRSESEGYINETISKVAEDNGAVPVEDSITGDLRGYSFN